MDGSGGTDSVSVKDGKWEYMKELPADVYTLLFISDVKAKQAKQEDVIVVMADSIPTEIDLTTGTVKGSKASEAMNATWKELFASMKNDNGLAAVQQMRKAVLDNTDSMLPVVFVPMMYKGLTYPELQKIFRPGAPYENHPAMKEAKEHMSQMQEEYQKERQSQTARAIGNKFTDIAMNDTTGRERRLSEWCGKGRYVLIDFWASWCGPCRAEMPNVTACYEKYHAKGLDIVAISFDTNKDAWLRAINTMKMPWVHLSDLAGWNSLGAKTYDIKGIPANILLDGEGNIIDNDLRDYMLEEKLAEIFGE
jgi:thiol-disulfide isomerase/thioredoxin